MPITDEDRALWHNYTLGIKPLSPKQEVHEDVPELSISSTLVQNHSPKIRQVSQSPSQRDLKNIHIHSRLDLHGHTEEQAYGRLLAFIENAYRKNYRCVLIITGKGLRSSDNWWQEVGILKKQVPRWFEEEPMRSKITTYTIAKPEHGGTGALYVFIRRK